MAEERLGASFTIDVTDLKAGLRTANNLIRESQSEFKAAAAGLDNWSKSEAGLNAKIKSLNQITNVQREKVRALKSEYDTLIKKGLDPASDKAIKLRTNIKNEEAALKSNEKELRKNQDALKNLGKESDSTGGKLEKLGKVAKTAAATVGAALAAAGAAVVGLTKNAIQNYAEYEQLVGGVSKLFGTSGQTIEEYAKSVGKSVDEVRDEYDKLSAAEKTVADNAANAFKTAGMSANEYMDTVTSFSASLISGLGGDTQKAAEIADIAIRDMSDNANTFGTDMSSIMHTYQGFAKQNYTMLDNLKLGYGGTQAEMARLINDSGVLGDAMEVTADTVKDVPFDKLILAINETQKRMNITGTTAKEAAGTIEGSVNMMKSAWQNLVTGLANDTADLTLLIDNLVESAITAFTNILPRVQTVMNGIVQLVERVLPEIPPIIESMLPEVIKGASSLLKGVVKILPDIVKAIMGVVPMLVDALIEAIPVLIEAATQFLMAIVEAIPAIVTALALKLPDIINQIIDSLITAIPQLLEAAFTALMAIVDAIPQIVEKLATELPKILEKIIGFLTDPANIENLVQNAIKLFNAIIDAIPRILTALAKALPQILNTIITQLTKPETINALINGAIQLFTAIITAIPKFLKTLGPQIPKIITEIVNGLIKGVPSLVAAGGDLLAGLITGLLNPKALWNAAVGVIDGITDAFNGLVDGLAKGITGFDFAGSREAAKITEDMQKRFDSYSKQASSPTSIATAKALADKAEQEAEKQSAASKRVGTGRDKNVSDGAVGITTPVVVNQTNNYSQQHSRYEIYQSKQDTAAAVRLAVAGVK